ncbi:MAG: malto-oligosyltrehalose synthase [Ktedonobacterales bacterium]|nr:malto-oligosyltrehalose synthase [Ktedonobacterales bacterium]
MATPALNDDLIPKPRIPRATYRLQFNPQFTFRDALAIVPYLDALGISECYISPILQARPGSMHGYDICDPARLNPELGSEADFDALAAELRRRGMGLLLDTVPNHMGIHCECNAWWMDVLENGPSSQFATFFDIDWHPIKTEIENKVLLPILGEQYGQALENGALQLSFDTGAFYLTVYGTQRLPIAPHTYRELLAFRLADLREQLGADHDDVQELESISTSLDHLPPPEETEPTRIAERYREKEVVKRRIATLYANSAAVRAMLDETVRAYNGDINDPTSYDALDRLISQQSYRTAYWRVAAEEINYRRFFDINELGAIRVEIPQVFDATHALILRLLAEGKVTGLRIDHPDGLWNPAHYFRQLQQRYVQDAADGWLRDHPAEGPEADALRTQVDETVATWRETLTTRRDGPTDWPLYVVVEKILSEREPLPRDWPVYGTTGYDFMNGVNDIFVARENERDFTELYRRFTGQNDDYATLVSRSKRRIMTGALISEINALGHQLERITERNRRYRDYTLNNLIDALYEVITYLQVYRTYTTEDRIISERDRHYIQTAIAAAKRHNVTLAEGIFDFIKDTLLLDNIDRFHEDDRGAVVAFVMKFQQVTGPIMAKSLEDTAFYLYNRLVSLNEVGGNPEQFGASVSLFHEQNLARRRNWPHALLGTSTHDTKRSEDVRARINVLSEMPGEWAAAVERWRVLNDAVHQDLDGERMPARNDEYLLYQTLIGIWPVGTPSVAAHQALRDRVAQYMEKAVQEGKEHSSWVTPNPTYTAALGTFIDALLQPGADNAFLADFVPFAQRVAYFGQFNALSQTLLKLTAPGVPDFYQGSELWELALVDPDNRRPVDYGARQQALADLTARRRDAGDDGTALCRELLAGDTDGRIKLYVALIALELRRNQPDLFGAGNYRAIEARGDCWQHVCAFAREHGSTSLIAVVPRLVCKLTDGTTTPPLGRDIWRTTWLTLPDDYAGRTYREAFTGAMLTVAEHDGVPGLDEADVLSAFPVALLYQE